MSRFAGRVESWELGIVTGWAIDRARPDDALELGLYDGDELLARFSAGLARPDLTGPSFGNGKHGFCLNFPQALLVRERHLFRIRLMEQGHDLPGSPHVYRQSVPILDMDSFTAVASDLRDRLVATTEFATARGAVGMLFGLLAEALPKFQALRAKAPEPAEDVIDLAHSFAPQIAALLTQLRDRYPAITLRTSDEPIVSVIVPAFERFAHTYQCLRSIEINPPALPYEVIVVDDGSMDETVFLTTIVTGVRTHRLPQHAGAVGSRNAGAALARGAFLLFLDNGAEVRPGWLDELHATFAADPTAGLVGAKLVVPDGGVLEAGGAFGPLGDRVRLGHGLESAHPDVSYRRQVDDCAGAAMMVPADLFRQLGGFDAVFAPEFAADSDFAFRIRQAGRRVYCQPLAEIAYHEAVPSRREQLRNAGLFFQRWRTTLASAPFNSHQDRGTVGRMLVIAETTPAPESGIVLHIRFLQALGYHVTLAPANDMADAGPATRHLQRMGIECLRAPFQSSVEEVLRKHGAGLDIVYLHGQANGHAYHALARSHAARACMLYFSGLQDSESDPPMADVDATIPSTDPTENGLRSLAAWFRTMLHTQGLPSTE